jgi:formylglycine-generating enzyme required for sulfatase activity
VKEFTDECKPEGNSALCAVRGGSFADTDPSYLICAGFGGFEPVRADQTVGFRCCKDVP